MKPRQWLILAVMAIVIAGLVWFLSGGGTGPVEIRIKPDPGLQPPQSQSQPPGQPQSVPESSGSGWTNEPTPAQAAARDRILSRPRPHENVQFIIDLSAD